MANRRHTEPIALHPARYGCHELRQDSEVVLCGRANPVTMQRYEGHLQECRDCRRFHRVLAALYAGPGQPVGIGAAHQEREFAAILSQAKGAPSAPAAPPRIAPIWRWGSALASAAAGLWLVLRGPTLPQAGEPVQAMLASAQAQLEPAAANGLGHRAQHFGRVLGGGATLSPIMGESSGDAFAVGTSILVDHDQSLQVGLLGKLIASLEPGSLMEWMSASAELVELKLDKGMLAIRYDRKPDEPILLIHTPDALVRVTGTVFTVEITPQGTTSVSVLRGAIQVHSPRDRHLMAEVGAGYRFDVASEVYQDVGTREVGAALPLADESPADNDNDPTSLIPSTWRVPGLPSARALRSIEQIDDPTPTKVSARQAWRLAIAKKHRQREALRQRRFEEEKLVRDLIESAVRSSAEAENGILAREMANARARCTGLYDAPETRLWAARCLQGFLDRYGTEPEARAEGLIAIGILRMDYARDFPASIHHFESFLKQFPSHSRAELVTYKLLLAHIESGDISAALKIARSYLRAYPSGAHVGRVLQRFPELKSAL